MPLKATFPEQTSEPAQEWKKKKEKKEQTTKPPSAARGCFSGGINKLLSMDNRCYGIPLVSVGECKRGGHNIVHWACKDFLKI